jgi:integrase/recombinase XerD
MGQEHAHLKNFLDMLHSERGAAQNTLDAYERDLSDALQYFASQGIDVTAITTKDVQAYLHHLSAEGLAATSRARRLSSLRQFTKFLANEGLIATDPPPGCRGRSGSGRCRGP